MALLGNPTVPLEISEEVLRLFPQVKEFSSEGDEKLPHVFIGNLIDHLEAQIASGLSSELIQRVQELAQWVQRHPRGGDAKDDVTTVFFVGFIEAIFESERLHSLIPKILSKEDLLNGKHYLVQWVGEANFDRALALY